MNAFILACLFVLGGTPEEPEAWQPMLDSDGCFEMLGGKQCLEKGLVLLPGTIKIPIAGDVIVQEDEIAVESLTDQEWDDLSKARKQLEGTLSMIRNAHGERRRGPGNAQNADCWSSVTSVEIVGKQALKRTQYANGGCF